MQEKKNSNHFERHFTLIQDEKKQTLFPVDPDEIWQIKTIFEQGIPSENMLYLKSQQQWFEVNEQIITLADQTVQKQITLFNRTKQVNQTKQLRKQINELTEQIETLKYDSITGLLRQELILKQFTDSLIAGSLSEFAVILGDIDNFKDINDQYGHNIGDECLNYIAQVLNQVTKIRKQEKDLVTRIGGDEFLLLFNHTSTEEISLLIGEIQKRILDSNQDMTMSFGVYYTPTTLQCQTKEQCQKLLPKIRKEADIALYESKTNGRNQATIRTTPLIEVLKNTPFDLDITNYQKVK